MDHLVNEEVINQTLKSRKKRNHPPEGPAITLVSDPQGPEIKITDEQRPKGIVTALSEQHEEAQDRESSPEKYKKFIENYKILKDLGEGTFGKVKLGVDVRT